MIDECMLLIVYQEPGAVLMPSKISSHITCKQIQLIY